MKSINIFKGMSALEVRMLLIMGPGSFMLMSSISSINVALPDIQRDFDIGLSALKWVSFIGAIMLATLSLCFGRMGDIMGRRKVYRTGILLYAIGASLCALAPSFTVLMSFRIVMAVAVAIAWPVSAAIMAAMVAPERRGQVLGLYAAFAAAGQLSGPSLGGFILQLADWRMIFAANGALGLTLCVGQSFVLRGEDERRPQKFDFWGAVLLLIGYPALLLALSYGPGSGWTSTTVLSWFIVAVAGLSGFVIRERKFEAPLFRFSYFRNPLFRVAVLTLSVGMFVQSPVSFFSPLYLRNVLGLDAGSVGLVLMALPLSTMICGPIGGRLADRYDPRVIASFGILLTIAAVVIYASLDVGSPIALALLALSLVGFGSGLFRPANQVSVYAIVDRSEYGVISGMLNSIGGLTGTLGTTTAVAFTEATRHDGSSAEFANAQHIVFTALLPLLIISMLVSLVGLLRPGGSPVGLGAPPSPEPAAAPDRP